ncbi:MAG: hypothetical protein EOO66_06970 [Methylobacterium sp.]|nr:MAG: hypothetical protein EOO66_06970 [Methylobacterium sp.]
MPLSTKAGRHSDTLPRIPPRSRGPRRQPLPRAPPGRFLTVPSAARGGGCDGRSPGSWPRCPGRRRPGKSRRRRNRAHSARGTPSGAGPARCRGLRPAPGRSSG